MVSQLSTLTGISGLFSLSGFTQLSVWGFRMKRDRRGGRRGREGKEKERERERKVLLARIVLSLPSPHQTVLLERISAKNVISHLQDAAVQL